MATGLQGEKTRHSGLVVGALEGRVAALEGELLCCSGNGNGPQPSMTYHPHPSEERISQNGFSTCSKRGGGSRFASSGLGQFQFRMNMYFSYIGAYTACP